VSEARARFASLRQSADAGVVAALESLVRDGGDRDLNRINLFDFAARHGLREDRALGTFLHASRLGLFDMSWNLLCPGCGGVLDANATLKTVRRDVYDCALCGAGYQPSLDEMIEVSFTVNPRVRRIAAHDPHALPIWEYSRQMYWCSGIDLPEGEAFDALLKRMVIDAVEVPAGQKRTLSLQLPREFCIVFEPVTHAAQFIDVQGEPASVTQELAVIFNKQRVPTAAAQMRPGPLRLTLENQTDGRTLPGVFIAGHDLHAMLGRRKRYLTAKQVLTNQTFRDIYRTDALDIDQRLKITSLTFLFTDLKGSTEMYERVGDLVAYDLVKAHFGVLHDIVAGDSGAVVKTIGDAVMATFPTPDRGLSAALRMREAMRALNDTKGREDLTLKIGVHEGPCLAVSLNDRLDYFGQTVNIAARVQGLAMSRAIFATQAVVEHPAAARLLSETGLTPQAQQCTLRGISDSFRVYEIP
jgi:class 3 adenylate cyclase